MDLNKFRENVVASMSYPSGDAKFEALRVYTHGMATARFVKTINMAVKCLAPDEFYCEIGTFSGFSLLGAAHDNTKMCIGIDDLSMEDFFSKEQTEVKDRVRQILVSNITNFGGPCVKFIESDFRNVQFEDDKKGKMGILLIDGKHSEKEVNDTLAWADPYLADNCLIFFDDAGINGVDLAICDLWKRGAQMIHYSCSNLTTSNEVSGYGTAIMSITRKK
jgi:Methyltransferase domain